MITKPCKHPGCHRLTDRRDGLCINHARQRRNEYARQQKSEGVVHGKYDAKWRKIRKVKLAMNPFCEHCEENGIVSLAILVHHVDRDTENASWSNLQSLCKTCHQIEHAGEVFRRKDSAAPGGRGKISEADGQE